MMNTRNTWKRVVQAGTAIVWFLTAGACSLYVVTGPGEDPKDPEPAPARFITASYTSTNPDQPYNPHDVLTVSWSGSEKSTPVSIVLYDGKNPVLIVASGLTEQTQYDWTIPSGLASGETYRFAVTYETDEKQDELTCFTEYFAIVPQPDTGLSDVTVDSRNIRITVTDNGSLIDGDTVTIRLNGTTVAAGHVLTGSPGTTFDLELQPGSNVLSIQAVNEGDVSPNTAELALSDVVEGTAIQEWRLLTGETGSLTISAP